MRRALQLALVVVCVPGCIAPSVLESSGRAPTRSSTALAWQPAVASDLTGLFESIAVEGEFAAALAKVYYHFAPGDRLSAGTYTGAALVLGGARPEFQTLSGEWSLQDSTLDLGDGAPVLAFSAPGHLKLESGDGLAILRSVALE